MRAVAVAGIILGVAVLAGAILFARWAGVEGGPLQIAGTLFANAWSVQKLLIMLLTLVTVAVAIMTPTSLLTQDRSGLTDALGPISLIAPLLGAAAACYGYLIVYVVATRTNTTNLMVVAPSIAEDSLALGLGLLAGGIAALPARRRKRAAGF